MATFEGLLGLKRKQHDSHLALSSAGERCQIYSCSLASEILSLAPLHAQIEKCAEFTFSDRWYVSENMSASAFFDVKVLSDLPAATALLERNVELNRHVFQSRGSASVKTLDYREALIDPYWHDFDLVLGTDLVWLKDQCLPVAQWCKACGAPIFLVSVPRWPWLKDGLLASFRAVGMIPHALNNGLLPGLVALLFLPAGRCPGDSVPWIAAHWDELGPDHEGVPELTEKARRTCAPACLRFRSTSQARMS